MITPEHLQKTVRDGYDTKTLYTNDIKMQYITLTTNIRITATVC